MTGASLGGFASWKRAMPPFTSSVNVLVAGDGWCARDILSRVPGSKNNVPRLRIELHTDRPPWFGLECLRSTDASIVDTQR